MLVKTQPPHKPHQPQRLDREAGQQKEHLEDISNKLHQTQDLLDAASYVEELQQLRSQVEVIAKEVHEKLSEGQEAHDRVGVVVLDFFVILLWWCFDLLWMLGIVIMGVIVGVGFHFQKPAFLFTIYYYFVFILSHLPSSTNPPSTLQQSHHLSPLHRRRGS